MHVHSADLRTLRDIGATPGRLDRFAEVLNGVFSKDPNAKHIKSVLEFLTNGNPDLSGLRIDGPDSPFLENLVELKRSTVQREHYFDLVRRRTAFDVDTSFDFLSESQSEWNLLRTMNYLAMSRIRPTKKLALLTSVRNEGVNLLEWIAHYRVFGVDTLFIYKNENDDGSDDLLRLLSDAGIITLIDNRVDLAGVFTIQKKVFEHAISFLPELWDHEWMLFVDPDEFLIAGDGENPATDLITLIEQGDLNPAASGICFNWKWFGSEGELRRKPGLALERYTHSHASTFVKTLARLRDVTGIRTAHVPRLIHGATLYDSGLGILKDPTTEIKPQYLHGQLNHYWNKSFEEFIAKRLRGKGNRQYEQFFAWGNQKAGEFDPVPETLLSRVKAEINSLKEIPGVSEQVNLIEREFCTMLNSFDAEHDVEKLYDQYRPKDVAP